MKKMFRSIAFVLMIPFIGNAQSGKLNLQQCIETAIRKNLQVTQAGLQSETEEVNWKQARMDLLPDLNGTASNGINQGRSIDPFTNNYVNQQINYANYGLSSGVTLFNGMSLRNSVKQTALAFEAAKMDWQQAKDNVTINTILAYLAVLNNQDLLVLAENQSVLSKKQVDRLVILDNDGAINPSLLSDLRGQYANDQLNIIDREAAVQSSLLTLCQLMNIPYDSSIKLEPVENVVMGDKYAETAESIYQVALKNFALIRAAGLRRQSAERGIRVAKGQLFPTLSLNGNVNTNYSSAARNDVFLNNTFVSSEDYVLVNGNPAPVFYKQANYSSQKIGYGKQLNNNLFTSFSLNLRIPIFNSFQSRNRVKLAQITLKNTEAIEATTKTQLQQNIEQAYINMNTALKRYKTLIEQVNAFSESFHAAEVRFNAGVGTSIDYLLAKNNLDRANVNLVTVRYDYLLRTKILDYYQGKQLW
jgi:outer membrane protein